MSETKQKALDECLQTQDSALAECLDRYPQQRAELVELLDLAGRLQALQVLSTPDHLRTNAAERLISRLPEQKAIKAQAARPTWQIWRLFPARSLRLVQAVLAALLLLVISAAGTAYAADFAGPGDALYGLDLAVERLQIQLAREPQAATRVHLRLAAERLEEAQNKLDAGDTEAAVIALDAYGAEVATLAQLVEHSEGLDQDVLQDLVKAALVDHQNALTNLPANVPPQAQEAIQRALEAGRPEGAGPPPDQPANPAGPTEPPAQNGKPEQLPAGPPEQHPGNGPEEGRKEPVKPDKNKPALPPQSNATSEPHAEDPAETPPPGPPEQIPPQPTGDEADEQP